MTMTKHVPDTFLKSFMLEISEMNNVYALSAYDATTGTALKAEDWVSFLYFRYERGFFGLTANMTEDSILLSPLDMIELFSPQQMHPFASYVGKTVYDNAILDAAIRAGNYWYSDILWDHIDITEDALHVTLEDQAINHLLELALTQKMHDAGLRHEDLTHLLPIFKDGGWPIQPKHIKDALIVALRLREPDEGETMWTLETVLRAKKSASYWTVPASKRKLTIERAMPNKWSDYCADVQQMQAQMLKLLTLKPYGAHLANDRFIRVDLTDQDVRQFLSTDFIYLQALGFEIVLPGWLKELKESRMKVQASASTASNYKSAAGLDEILTFNWKLSLDGHDVSIEEFEKMVAENREFIRAGTEWIRVDAAWMQEIRELMEKAEDENWTVRDLLFKDVAQELSLPMEMEDDSELDDPVLQFELQRSLKDYVQKIVDKQGLPEIPAPETLQAELRPYQQIGFDWLVFMREQKFGACLADDMGLGKTIQLISYLLHVYKTATKPTLIICPTSVLGNWQKELERFAPSLNTYLHYGAKRLKESDLTKMVVRDDVQIMLTTYGTVTQDIDLLESMEWANVTLDEAQNIKNMNTKQSKAIRRLRGEHHIALTGTPVENRLSELWAIFDFIYKGYLGSFSKFQEQYIAPIERDNSDEVKEQLRRKIQPFLLRRTKQDPDLRLNLPDKIEQREYCPLTEEQAVLYESFIQETMHKLETLSGFERKGLILKMLGKLKQLCNHPTLYLKEPFDNAEDMIHRSEKLERIVNLGAEIVQNGEQCLIFTQYIGMGHLMQHCFSELYDIDVPFLTGSMPKQQRDHFVESFQRGDFPIFILSLKAGGTGLNLTAASHVLHADRWWNPAVENQATDRAYRLGQTQFVHVHKFMTTGTIEEKIDVLLTEKQTLSEQLIQSSNWITELNDDELKNLLSFSY
ncbi:DEAD/DEAH box helicase [Kurthia massiliensis]|uniref:DEAD/DEAH box helicase n=1 Tax=Kurthia massiliensis TaxID=1033739 RepID=UPI00028A3907